MKIYLSAIICLLLLTSCASIEEKIEIRKNQIAVIDSSLKDLSGEKIYFSLDDQRSVIRYFVVDDMIQYITEENFKGDTSHSVNQYYFDDDDLLQLIKKEIIYSKVKEGPRKKIVETNATFDYNGTLLTSIYRTNTEERELNEQEANLILEHAGLVIKAAIEDSNNKK